MDTRTGEIMNSEGMRRALGESDYAKYGRPIDPANLSSVRRQQLAATGRTKIGRNELCPCGSGAKFKRCCIAQEQA